MSAGRTTTTLLLGAIFLGCAPHHPPDAAGGVSSGTIELVSIEPSGGSVLPGTAVVSARLRYTVTPFAPDRYFVIPEVAADPESRSVHVPNGTWLDVTAARGEATVRVSSSDIAAAARSGGAVRMWFELHQGVDGVRSRRLSKTVPTTYVLP